MSYRPTIAVDFDGVIHRYSRGWQGSNIYDPPMDETAEALQILNVEYRLVIFTARLDLDAVWAWLTEWDLKRYIAEVTNTKPMAALYIDDRCLRFERWSDALPLAQTIMKELHNQKRAS